MGKLTRIAKRLLGLRPRQVAALPYRRTGRGVEILLVTSRGHARRHLIPKGWPMPLKHDPESAAIEAFEEAGVIGRVSAEPLGHYTYRKRVDARLATIDVAVYPLEFERQAERWKEKGARDLGWYTPEEAARLVDEPELKALIAGFG